MNHGMLNFIRLLLVTLFLISSQCLRAQFVLISRVHEARDTANSIYSVSIRNSSNDSIMVLHTQEAMYPPFINKYKWERESGKDTGIIVYLGKSDNPLLPEKYRATKTLPPKGELQLYFLLPSNLNHLPKTAQIYFSMLQEKYYADFQKLESVGTNSALKRCQYLKQKHGRVFNKKVTFR